MILPALLLVGTLAAVALASWRKAEREGWLGELALALLLALVAALAAAAVLLSEGPPRSLCLGCP